MEGQIDGRAERQNDLKAFQRVFDLIRDIDAAEICEKLRFLRTRNGHMDGQTDGRTNGRTDPLTEMHS